MGMRILSQRGRNYFDLPYEKCVIWLQDSIVKISPLGEPDSNYIFAVYSTEEKALKAMEMLHEAYTGTILMKNVEMSDEEKEQIQKSLSNGHWLTPMTRTEDIAKIEPPNIVWRFPQEDEL